jgi:hypothetical protein
VVNASGGCDGLAITKNLWLIKRKTNAKKVGIEEM